MLETERLRLRALEPTDLEQLYLWENDTAIWEVGSTLNPFSKAQLKTYITQSHHNIYYDLQIRFIIETTDGESVGCADLYDFEPRIGKAGVAVLIDKKYRHQGYAFEALQLLEQYAFEFIRMHQLFAFVPKNNVSSNALFTKLSYKPMAELKDWVLYDGKYENAVVYQKINLKQK